MGISVGLHTLHIRSDYGNWGAGYHYPAVVGAEIAEQIGEQVRKHVARKTCVIICDSNVAPLLAKRVIQSLSSADFRATLITIPAGEKSKTLAQVGTICDRMIAAGMDRQSFVIGLGGGVIGDISGFVAAIYHRGIPHVQIPTTLLAMVDSSIGGKTGVNTRDGKNLIGAIHHPSLVIDDVDVLKTLPRREFNQGFAEIIKHAVIADAKMFRTLQRWKAGDAAALPRKLSGLIGRNIEIKSKIVAKDERDRTGERALLNFGHTVGHAIERAGDYRKFLHGEALSLGIIAACAISIRRAGLAPDQRDAIGDLLARLELPTRLPKNFPRKKVFDALKFDKKFEGGKVRFVVTPRIGAAHLATDVTLQDIRKAIENL
jgi:3-dehydroquinate synthase